MPSLKRESSATNASEDVNNKLSWKATLDKLVRASQSADFYIICVIICSLIPAFFILVLVVPQAMVDDGITTIQEMLKTLEETRKTCSQHLSHDLPPQDDRGNYHETYCKGEWDNLACWPHSAPGENVVINCPEYIVDFDHTGKALRFCNKDGTWATVKNSTQIWADYSGCRYPDEEDIVKAIKNGDPKITKLIDLYTVGYSSSLVALIIAMAILAYFKRLHCTRNFIHMHLFASFILRALVIFVKDRVLYHGAGILDVHSQGKFQPEEIQENESSNIGCKLVMTLFHYFVATNYYWILVEALYLHSLIFVAFFSDKKYLFRFTVTGWGVPILFVVPWAVVRILRNNTACWDIAVPEYKWIYNGPIVVANVINFLLFLNIIRVLWYKMRERGFIGRTDNRRQYKKLAKSTLVLIPMFGVHAIIFIGMPDYITSGVWWDIRMYFDLFFNSFQGFFVAIIYCFCNGEVQAEFKKTWERSQLTFEIRKDRRERSRSSVTLLTSFNSSMSQQARLSIGGQSSNRNGNSRTNGLSLQVANNHSVESKAFTGFHKGETESQSKNEAETSFSSQPNDLHNRADVQIKEDSPTINKRPPFIRTQSSTLPKGSDVILPIDEEKDLEEAFESAMEEQISCPASSFNLADAEEAEEIVLKAPGDSDCQLTKELDDVIGCEETILLRKKRKQRSRRAESKDSGISSASTFYASLQSRERNPSASNSDYMGDSEGVASDDVRHSSDAERLFSKNISSDVTTKMDISKDPKNVTFLSVVKESGV